MLRCFMRTHWVLSQIKSPLDWNDVVTEVQEYVPHDVRVPVEAVMAILGPKR